MAFGLNWRFWHPFLLAAMFANLPTNAAIAADNSPKLIVVLVFDQMRADYLTRWVALFEDGGFRKLCQQGAWFQNCHYPYAMTVTAAGHASMATGSYPQTHGIMGNDWFEPAAGRTVSCTENDRWKLRIWLDEPLAAVERPAGSPERLLVPTFGDLLKHKYGDTTRVISLSVKERSAVFLGGHKADACYWPDPKTGYMATSSYYSDRIHEWVRLFNNERPADQWVGGVWNKLRSDVDYEAQAGPDDVVGEGVAVLGGRTFPHRFPDQPGPAYYESLAVSPFASDLLIDLATRAIRSEKLGQRDSPDVLCISFSSNDLIGHVWGPDSQEVLDATLRSDCNVKTLLDELDRSVGPNRYVVAVCSDHGVCPLPAVLQSRGIQSGILPIAKFVRDANQHLNQRYSAKDGTNWIASTATNWIAVDRGTVADSNQDPADVCQTLAEWIETQPGILMALTRKELSKVHPDEDPIKEMVRRSFLPDRAGDIAVIPKPYYFFSSYDTGTTHGTPHEYDTHVPLLFFGSNIRPGIRDERVAPQAMATALLAIMGMEIPETADVPVPDDLIP